MNTMTELLVNEIHESRIAERHAEADVRRLLRQARATDRPARTWSLGGLLRLPTFGRRVARPL